MGQFGPNNDDIYPMHGAPSLRQPGSNNAGHVGGCQIRPIDRLDPVAFSHQRQGEQLPWAFGLRPGRGEFLFYRCCKAIDVDVELILGPRSSGIHRQGNRRSWQISSKARRNPVSNFPCPMPELGTVLLTDRRAFNTGNSRKWHQQKLGPKSGRLDESRPRWALFGQDHFLAREGAAKMRRGKSASLHNLPERVAMRGSGADATGRHRYKQCQQCPEDPVPSQKAPQMALDGHG